MKERYDEKLVEKAVKMYQRAKEYALRQRIRRKLLVQKAIEAGIVVSEEEIDEYIAKHYNK